MVIRNAKGLNLCDKTYNQLPQFKYITVSCQYDGKAIVRKNQKTHYIYRLSPEQDTIIDNLSFGTEICFYNGCDCVHTLSFVNEKHTCGTLDDELIKKLSACSGSLVPFHHSMGTILSKFTHYPKTRQWILRCIHSGQIPRSAYRLLQAYMPSAK